jgi:hypothetical protein
MKKLTPVQLQRKAAHDAVLNRIRKIDEMAALSTLHLSQKEIRNAQKAVGYDLGPEDDDFNGSVINVNGLFRG